MAITNKDVLKVYLIELVISGGVKGGNVFVREAEDPVTGLTTARLHLLEQECEGVLRVGQGQTYENVTKEGR